MTATEVARRTGETVSTITRRERSEWKVPDPATVQTLIDLYSSISEITEGHQQELIALAHAGNTEGWWDRFRDRIPNVYADFYGLEHAATSFSICDPLLLPTILHTPAYARTTLDSRYGHHLGTVRAPGPEDHPVMNQFRQQLLQPPHPMRLHAIIDMVALQRRPMGVDDDQMLQQLRFLYEVAQRENVVIQILPWEAAGHPTLHTLGILDLGNDTIPEACAEETLHGMELSMDPERVWWIKEAWAETLPLALSPEESLTILRGLAEPTGGWTD